MNFYQDLQNAVISISTISNNEINAEFCFDHTAAVFLGHFPKMPIVPGVMQLEMTKHAIEQAMAKRFRISSVRKTKFTKEIKPGDRISIKITLADSDEGLSIKAVLKSNDLPAGKNTFSLIEV